MDKRLFILTVCSLIFSACTSSQKTTRHVASQEGEIQKMSGFVQIEANDSWQKYQFRDHGDFLISKKEFSRRDEAIGFCASVEGYRLSDWVLPMVMAMSGLHFAELREKHIVEPKALDGNHTLSGEPRGGAIFWVKGIDEKQEALFSKGPDIVYAMLNGCGPGCEGAESLSSINKKLEKLKSFPRALKAICPSLKLQEHLNRN